MANPNVDVCKACGDPATCTIAGVHYCGDCYVELTTGEIKNQNVNFFGGRTNTGKDDDPSPWNENAVRDMEGD